MHNKEQRFITPSGIGWPSRREAILTLCIMLAFLSLTAMFVGLRTEHWLLAILFMSLFFVGHSTRKLAVALLPFILFGISYDWMRVYPNYLVHSIDVADLYHLEKAWFGCYDGGVLVTPCDYFVGHHSPIVDFLAGLFYLCWVPVPIAFGLWLYVTRSRELYLRFSLVFLLVNLLGFAGYYIHPAAPPWYAINYGFEAVLHTPGNAGGLERFDALTGLNIFHSLYGRNANVFAAVPSLHAAYMVVTVVYAIKRPCRWYTILLFTIIMLGIWFTAVYSTHHYIIDVLLGISCALLGVLIFEKGLMKWPRFHRFFERYHTYIR